MKKLVFALLAIISLKVTAQNRDTYLADSFFNRSEYINAAHAYREELNKNKASNYIYKKLADSYYKVSDAQEANRWYAKAITQKQDAETYYHYAEMLKEEGKYEEANKQMQQFTKMLPRDQRAITFKENPDYLKKLDDIVKAFEVKRLKINSNKSDFGAVLANDNTLYFASARNTSRKIYGWNGEPFLDLYKAIYNANGTFSEPIPVTDINSKYHDGPATISADGNTMYFASESFKRGLFQRNKAKKIKQGQINLFKATKVNGKWDKITALPFNSRNYSTSNPCLSPDGKTLYFSSDMPGSVGGVDIWKVTIHENNRYGKPQNLGKKINTKGNESFPFIMDDNKLYFASNGHLGFGGLDVYSVDLDGDMTVINLGKPVNSAKDDFAFTFNKNKNVGFVSSNRDGADNIYRVTPLVVAERTMLAETEAEQREEKELEKSPVNEKRDLVKNEVAIKIEGKPQGIRIQSEAIGQQSDNTYKDEKAISGHKDNGKKEQATTVKENRIVGATTHNVNPGVPEGSVKHAVATGAKILNDIHFDFDKSVINDEAAAELDKLVQIMKENPEMVVMVKSHTDSRGKQVYNLKLSEKRAAETVRYVVSKGISKERIYGKGYGESVPKVICQGDCSAQDHFKNRRSEFIIVKK